MNDNGYNTYATGKLMHHRAISEWHEYGIEGDFGPYAFNGRKAEKHPSMPKAYSDDKNDGLFTSLADIPDVEATRDFPGYKGWYDIKNRKPFKYINDDNRDLLSDEKSANWAVEKNQTLISQELKKPFFMTVGFVRAHTPLVAPQKYFDLSPLETLKIPIIKQNDNKDTYYRSTFKRAYPWAQHFEELKASCEQSYSVRSEKFRYILYVNGKEELYNHTNDRNEWTNLASNNKYVQIKAGLRKQMTALLNIE